MSNRVVLDSSALVEFLRSTATGRAVDRAIDDGDSLHLPDLCSTETINTLRGLVCGKKMTPRDATRVVAELLEFPADIHPCDPMLDRMWELRHNLSAYDAAYVALCEALDAKLVTADRRLARGARGVSDVRVVTVS
jgi:predicted nucleic acid-binding protein